MTFQADSSESDENSAREKAQSVLDPSLKKAAAPGALLSQHLAVASGPEGRLHLEVQNDLTQVEALLVAGVKSGAALPRELADRLVLSGGKRIRPYLTCLSYRCLTRGNPRGGLEDLHALAAVAEWVHTATLFHDDVLDASPTRRDQVAAHISHGNKIAILVGDFVYAEAFSRLMERGLLVPSQRLAETVKTIVEGELLQHQVTLERSLRLKDYDQIACAKTGSLFAWCTGTGAWMAGSDQLESAFRFGEALGYAFQMADDLFDSYDLDPLSAPLNDLVQWAESAPPLPLILANESDSSLAAKWIELGQSGHSETALRERIQMIQKSCLRSDVVERSVGLIEKLLERARLDLQETGASQGLEWALDVIATRAYQGAELARSVGRPKGRN